MSYAQNQRKVAYLDTNVLHYMDLWISFATSRNLYPFPASSPGSVSEATRNAKGVTEENLSQVSIEGVECNLVLGQQGIYYAVLENFRA